MTNLIFNGNFENASLAPWVSYSSGEIIFAIEHGRTNIYLNEGRCIQQAVKKLPSHAKLCFYARVDTANSQVRASFVVSLYGIQADQTPWCSPAEFQPHAEWQRFTHEADIPDSLGQCGVSIRVNKAEAMFEHHERRKRNATGCAVQFRDFQLG